MQMFVLCDFWHVSHSVIAKLLPVTQLLIYEHSNDPMHEVNIYCGKKYDEICYYGMCTLKYLDLQNYF